MTRSAASLPPSCDESALATIASGISAVSAPEANAIARSKPASFWNRLTTRSTNSGRSQNVSVRTARSRFTSRRRSSSGSEGTLILTEDEDAVDDVEAEEEDAERPPGVRPADRQQCGDRAQAGGGDADDAPPGVAGHQRHSSGQLDQPDDDQHPPQRVEVGEDEAPVVREDVRVVQRPDAVDDVQGADDQQQYRGETDSARTSHGHTSFGIRPTLWRAPRRAHHPIGTMRQATGGCGT